MAAPDELFNIETPENVAINYTVAGIGSRFLAGLIDALLILALQAIVWLVLTLGLAALRPNFSNTSLSDPIVVWLTAAIGLLAFALLWGYYVFFEFIWNGQSPGKRWMKLRVIHADGTPITQSGVIIRNIVRLVDFLPFGYGLGVVTMFVDSRSRRLGDMAAEALVIIDSKTVSLQSVHASLSTPHESGPQASSTTILGDIAVERLTDEDIALAERFLRRGSELRNRAALGQSIVEVLQERMSLPSVTLSEAEMSDWLVAVIEARKRRNAD